MPATSTTSTSSTFMVPQEPAKGISDTTVLFILGISAVVIVALAYIKSEEADE